MIENKKTVSAFLLLLLTGFLIVPLYAATVSITVDGSVRQGTVPHFWSECVGTGTMEYCLKPAWQTAARIGAQEAGFKRVRGHGLLIHWNGVDSIHVGTSPNWSFTVIDKIIDTVIACGLHPIIELDFMPTSMQSNGVTSHPNNLTTWQNFIAALATNLESRYTVAEVRKWYWEVWNEYDYSGFWNGSATDYYDMFNYARLGVRSVDTNIIIGGPATTGNGPLSAFLTNCPGTKFLSNHQYGNGPATSSNPLNMRNDNQTRSTLIKNSGKKLFSLNTEYNSSYAGSGGNVDLNDISMDSHINAAFVAKSVKVLVSDCIGGANLFPDVFSYWAISDCFDESSNNLNSWIEAHNNIPFAQIYGLVTYQGIRKAAFNCFKMLNMMGTTGLSLTNGSGDNDGIDGFATVNADSSQVSILVYSYYADMSASSADNTVSLEINHLPFANSQQLTVHHYRVDSLHNNPYAFWLRWGKPVTPTAAQWDTLRAHDSRNGLDSLEASSVITYTGAAINKSFSIPRYGVSLLTYTKKTISTIIPAKPEVCKEYLLIHGTMLVVNNMLNGSVHVVISSVDGKVRKQFKTTQKSFDLSKGLEKGLYIVDAKISALRLVKKMVVQ